MTSTNRRNDAFIRDLEEAMKPREDWIPGRFVARFLPAGQRHVANLRRAEQEEREILNGGNPHEPSKRQSVLALVTLLLGTAVFLPWIITGAVLR